MIYITGDIHGNIDIHKLNTRKSHQLRELTKEDYVIVCGDFGLVWDNSRTDLWWRKWLDKKPFTTLFIDGNHENFDLLYDMEEIDFCGGKAHRVSDSIFHLMRGYVFDLQGKAFFAMGGAQSHDKEYRKEGISWWSRELPDNSEYERAVKSLSERNFRVDYVLTHSIPSYAQSFLGNEYERNELTDFFDEIKQKLEYKLWFSGHYHRDKAIDGDDRIRLIYNDLIPIE